MPSVTYTLFRDAILAEQQVTCAYGGYRRELCPHIIGINKDGEEVVLAWQFGARVLGRCRNGNASNSSMSATPAPATGAGMRAVRTRPSRAASRRSTSTSISTCARIAVEKINRS
jgi:hypothetical protein